MELDYEPLEKFFDRILKGSYPALYHEKENDLETFYSAYIKTYIERDIRELIRVKDEIKFLKFISAVAARTAQEYNANDIGRDSRLHLYYYRDNSQKEIDLLIIDQDNIYPVGIKKSANPTKEAIKNFDIIEKFEMNSPNGIVLCLTKDIHALDSKNYMVPIEYI